MKAARKTADELRTEREAALQQVRLAEITDRLVVDAQGNIHPAPPGPSIFDV